MADYNRNRGAFRNQNQDWNERRGQNSRSDEDREFSDRGYSTSNQEFDEADSGWQSRYEREDYNRGGEYDSGRFGRQYDGNIDTGNYMGERGQRYGSGSTYGGKGYGNAGSGRNLYDRDYEGMNRGSYANSGTRLGGGNYGGFGDRSRGMYEDRSERRSYGGYGSGYSGNYGGHGGSYGSSGYRNRDRDQDRDERTWWDRTTDEVSSWFGDDEAQRRRERDKQLNYRGKGPKNYNRSDERIKEDVNDRLSDDPFVDATEIDVTVSNGEVTLVGMVEDRSAKRRAEDLAESVSGVRNVENRLRVGKSSETRNPERGSGTTGPESTQNTSAVSGSERTRGKGQYVTG